jgi:hypothetical protein
MCAARGRNALNNGRLGTALKTGIPGQLLPSDPPTEIAVCRWDRSVSGIEAQDDEAVVGTFGSSAFLTPPRGMNHEM